jgi:DNA mismatch repair protein MutS
MQQTKQPELFEPQKIQALTPMMQQYMAIKAEHQDCLLFYRMGDFYELFFQDAVTASEVLDIVLTKRGKHEDSDIPMCGVPAHSNVFYLEKLIKAGYKVAVCEQLETPEQAKKRGYKAVVKREVVRIITSGTLFEETLLDARESNYLAAVGLHEGKISIAWVEISTGEFYFSNSASATLLADLSRLQPKEVIVADKLFQDVQLKQALQSFAKNISVRANATFELERSKKRVKDFFNVVSLEGIASFNDNEVCVVGGLLEYLEHTQKGALPRLSKPKKINSNYFMVIDPATKRNLELDASMHGDSKAALISVLDKTITSAGGRLLRLYLSSPLCNAEAINKRLDSVECFVKNKQLKDKLRDNLRSVPDLERSLSRIWIRKGGPRDLAMLRDGLSQAIRVSEFVLFSGVEISTGIKGLVSQIGNFSELLEKLHAALTIETPIHLKDGGFIRAGYSAELDYFYNIRQNSKQATESLRDKYRQLTGVNTLRISYNNVLGYFVEVTPSHASKITDEIFIHRQTLGSSMRYTTDELRKLESDILSAEGNISNLEQKIFEELCVAVTNVGESISYTAQALAGLDVFAALAQLATEMNYNRPIIDETKAFEIVGGRHPVVEKTIREKFVSNDCNLGIENNIWLITGPNMAGKSTFLRQNAVICIMAQMGSYIPAKSAHIGVVDRLFSRIGAADDISRGQSTFMVEMVETATILNNATSKSLVILDEIGRGTSTYDGLSIAWAVIENLHNQIECRTLFATHYHELTDLEADLPRLACYTVSVKEWEDKIIFMHHVVAGKANRSYGIHVASLAGLPNSVVNRANEILKVVEGQEKREVIKVVANENIVPDYILDIKKLDIDSITPREAFDVLYKLKSKME